MKQIQALSMSFLLAGTCIFGVACSNENPIQLDDESIEANNHHTAFLNFNGSVEGFDQQTIKSGVQTKGSNNTWSTGDTIYITFFNGTTIVPGIAIYNATTGWLIEYDGEIATGPNLKCEVRYFINSTYLSPALVVVNERTEIYEDVNGVYAYDNDTISISATLVPKTGRIRFKGTKNTTIRTTGISFYTSYAPAINTFTTDYNVISSQVATDGYTPYIYGWFKGEDRTIGLISQDDAYTRNCSEDVFKIGESGYMTIPTADSHINWRSGLFIKVGGVEYKMIPVVGCSGGFFLIGETEVTEGFYYSASGEPENSQYPMRGKNNLNIRAFGNILYDSTKLRFDLPTSTQWTYAAKGGNKSLGYTYSGSNNIDDVAWYSGNASAPHEVKTKAPNEIGLYDMCGNVCELVSDQTGHNYDYYNYYIGGSYALSSGNCSMTSYNGDTYQVTAVGYQQIGFRLIIK